MTRRRGNREGSIRRRRSGLWEGSYRARDGVRRSVYAKTRTEVAERLREAITADDRGHRPQRGRAPTVTDWMATWMETAVRPNRRPRTIRFYEQTLRLYVLPAIGTIRLDRLEPIDISLMIGRLGHLSPRTRHHVFVVVRTALRRAVRDRRIPIDPTSMVDAPTVRRREIEPPPVGVVRSFLTATSEDRFHVAYLVAASTGIRQGDLLALRWDAVDLDRATVAIRHTLAIDGTLAPPKSANSRRVVSLPPMAVEALRDHRRRQLEDRLIAGPRWLDDGFVFATRTGGVISARNLMRAFYDALARTGTPRFRWHDFRHVYASALLANGEDILVVSRSLGHAAIGTTADLYGHVAGESLRRSADRMEAILAG